MKLDRFLFPRDDTRPIGSCLHQMPLRTCMDWSDFCVLQYLSKNAGYDQSNFVTKSVFKSIHFPHTKRESYAYALKGAKVCFNKVRLVFLACTKHRGKLIVVFAQNERQLYWCL